MGNSMKSALAIMSLIIAGCGGGMMPLKPDAAKTLRNRQVTPMRVPPATSFSALEFNPVLGGAIFSNAVAVSKGKSLIANNNIPDPAIELANNLGRELNARYRTKTAAPVKAKVPDDITKKNFPRTDLALYVRTISWRLAYYASDFGSYYVDYKAEFALIDVKQDTVLAKGTCHISPDDPERGFEFDDFVRNNASLLKRELRDAVGSCTNLFKFELFPQ